MTIKNALKQLAPKAPESKGPEQAVEETPPLDRQEIVDLINIRQYVVNSTANPTMDRASVNYLNGALIMIDRKIMGLLQSDQFKEYINYGDVKQAIAEVARLTNIKSGLKK